MKKTYRVFRRVINHNASANNTFLSPYRGYECSLIVNGNKKFIVIDGQTELDVSGRYTSEYNNYKYTVEKLLSPKQ